MTGGVIVATLQQTALLRCLGSITTPTLGLLFLLGEHTAHFDGIPMGLIYHCIIYKPSSLQTPTSKQLHSEGA